MINRTWRERLALADRLICVDARSAASFAAVCALETLRRAAETSAKALRNLARRTVKSRTAAALASTLGRQCPCAANCARVASACCQPRGRKTCRTPKTCTRGPPSRRRRHRRRSRASSAGLRHDALSDEVRHYARRHLLDTVGVMISGAGGNVATQAEAVLATSATRRQRAGARPRAPRRPDRRSFSRRHRRPRHRARRRLHQGLRASRLHRRACGTVGRLRQASERRRTDRSGGRGLRDGHRHRPRRASRPPPPRLPSDRRGVGVRRGDGGRKIARAHAAATLERARDRGVELGWAVRLRQWWRRHQAAACRPCRARGTCRRRCWPSAASTGRPT